MTAKLLANFGGNYHSSAIAEDAIASRRLKLFCSITIACPKMNILCFCPTNRFRLQPLRSLSSSSSSSENGDQNYHSSAFQLLREEEDEGEEKEARQVVAEILQELGASKEDSIDIALRCPKYSAMLLDGVRELDELSLWNEQSSSNLLSLKQKLYYVAKNKGDKGMLPFLESLGLNFPSATHLAHYISSQMLSDLIHKVKYVRKMFFSNPVDEGRIGNNARRMMKHLSISVDEDVQQTLSFFEKIEARRGGLEMLGSHDASFGYFVESFPRFLLLSLEFQMKPLVEFLEDVGVPRGCMRNILLLFPPFIFYDLEKDIKLRIQAFEKVGASKKDFGRMLLKYPWILSTGILENYEKVLSFFDMQKVPKVSVNSAIKSWPLILGCSISKLKLMVEQFGEFGVRNRQLGQIITTSPQILLRKQEFLQVVTFLEGLGLDEESIGRILCRCPELFATNIETNLKKKVDFLVAMGVSKTHLPRVIRKYPELLVCDVNRTMRPRMKYLMKSGLSKREIASMIGRFSPLLGYSVEEVLRPKLEFLVNTMEKPVKEVVEYPRYFSYSLERKIKPRFWVLKGRNMECCSLKDMLAKNDEEFASEFLLEYGSNLQPSTSTDDR